MVVAVKGGLIVSSFCIINDAQDLCQKLLTEIEEMPESDKRACLAQIHGWFVELVEKAESEAKDLVSEKESEEEEATKWETKYDREYDRNQELECEMDDLKAELEELRGEKANAWRQDPDPYDLHKLNGCENMTTEEYFCAPPLDECIDGDQI